MVSSESNCFQYVVILVSVVIIIVNIVCGILVGYNNGQKTRELKQPIASKYQWCLPCGVLTNKCNSQLMEKLDRKTEGNVEKCCGNNSEQVSAIMEMVMSSTEDDPEPLNTFNAGNFSLSKASAHVDFALENFQSYDDQVFFEDENMKLEFDINPDNPFGKRVRNIEVTKSALVVLQEGSYFIYSSIFFKPDSARQCKDLKKQIWEHNIVLTRKNDQEHSGTILKSTYTCCDTCTSAKETSYIGGLFNLEENDQLHLEVSSDGVVSLRKEGSYLGVFMLT